MLYPVHWLYTVQPPTVRWVWLRMEFMAVPHPRKILTEVFGECSVCALLFYDGVCHNPLELGEFLLLKFSMKLRTYTYRDALWGWHGKFEIWGQYLHPLSIYRNFNFFKCVKKAKRNRLVRWKVERRMADFWQSCNWFFNNKSGPLHVQFLTVRLNFQAIVFYVFNSAT